MLLKAERQIQAFGLSTLATSVGEMQQAEQGGRLQVEHEVKNQTYGEPLTLVIYGLLC